MSSQLDVAAEKQLAVARGGDSQKIDSFFWRNGVFVYISGRLCFGKVSVVLD